MKNTKFLLVTVLTCIALMSFLGIGVCLWAAWAMYVAGSTKACVLMFTIAGAFIAYQLRVILRNKSEIIQDLKEVWRGRDLNA